MEPRFLAVIEHGYRGAAEVQFCDLLYLSRGLHHQLGGLDVALRGSAVTLALAGEAPPALRLGSQLISTLPDHCRSLRALLSAGASVYADESCLHLLRLDPSRLIPGVICLDTTELVRKWPAYEGVWFL